MPLAFLFAKGLLIGFSIAMPVGPIAVLCINRSLTRGPRAGLATGMGAKRLAGAAAACSPTMSFSC